MNASMRVLLGFALGAASVAAAWWLLGHDTGGVVKGAEPPRVLYYRNPMGESDTSAVPKKDSMGMDYIPVYASAAQAFEGNVVLGSSVLQNLGVRTARVERKRLSSALGTVGFVQFDESRISHVHALAEGWVRELHAHTVGDRVEAGQTLMTLYSPQMLSAQGEYLAALRGGNRGVIAAARRRLELLAIPEAVIARLEQRREPLEAVPVIAERGGYLSELQVREGMFITPELEVMTIGELGRVWVIAEVFERQIGLLAVGDAVTIGARSVPGREWSGKIDFLYPMLDAVSRTARVRVVVENADETLKPNMAVDLQLLLAAPEPALALPRDALIRGGDGDRAVLRYADGSFRSVAVRAGQEYGDYVEVLEGLREGDTVVTSAQFLIDSESSIKAELGRLESEGAAPPQAAEEGHDAHAH